MRQARARVGGLLSCPERRPLRYSKGESIGAVGASGSTDENDREVTEAEARAVSDRAAGAGASECQYVMRHSAGMSGGAARS